MGARGSGEVGPGTPGWQPTSGDPYGLGGTVNSAYHQLTSDLGGRRTVQVMSVHYAANRVQTLGHAPREYFHNLAAGVSWAEGHLLSQAKSCPDQEIVLAGFSQGAMVMHRTLRDLEQTSAGAHILSRLAGAILIGDGDQVPNDSELRYGSSPRGDVGIGLLLPKLSHSVDVKFSRGLGKSVLRVCNKHDPVCDITPLAPWDPLLVKIHLSYPGSPPLLAAANHVSAMVRAVPLPTPRTVELTATVGKPFRYQLTADVGSGYTLQWGLLPPEVMPPGMGLDASGLISGTPTTTGNTTTLIRVRSVRSGKHSVWVPATIKLDVVAHSIWSETVGPLPAGVNSLGTSYSSVACDNTATCVAVGEYQSGQTDYAGLLLTGYGSSWTATEAPLPANAWSGPFVTLSSVACGGPSACAAVGSYAESSNPDINQGLLLTGSGSSWTATEAPLPAGADSSQGASLSAVACPASNWCVAVGEYADSAGATDALVETGFGSSWTATGVALPGNPVDGLSMQAVACPATTNCVAGGDYPDASGNDIGLLLTGSGSSWTATEAPLPAGAKPENYTQPIVSLACSSTAACVAVGYYRDLSNNTQGLLLEKQGTTWQAEKAPVPPNARGNPSVSLNSISCPSTSVCSAVGSYFDQSGENQGLILTMSGSSWTPTEAPLPANAESSGYGGIAWLNAVSCSSTTQCVAVGGYDDTSGSYQGLLLTRFGSHWSTAEAPLPANTSNMVGYGPVDVSCLSATQCEAIGYYAQTTGDPNAFDTLLISGPG